MYQLKIEDMSCGHCASLVTKAVKSVDPSARIDIDLGTRQVLVDSRCELADISDALAEAGYPAKSVG